VLLQLRSLRFNRQGSVPLQYALVAVGTALVAAVMVAQTAAGKVAAKLGAVSSALTKIQF
jgi:hypothetical protein